MLEVIQFDDGTYGIRNVWSDQILAERGEILSYPDPKRAEKKARKIAKNLNRALRKAEKKGKL